MNTEPIIMNFSGIYEEEDFYKELPHRWLECKDITGVNGYCAEEAQEEIRERIKEEESEALHFIDSGNYHYVSKFWLEKLQKPFTLIVFDQHTDMQESAFFGILSCGSWIKDVLETNPYVKQVCVIGPPEEAINSCKIELADTIGFEKVKFISAQELEMLEGFLKEETELPVYLSIDKDALSLKDARTNWDQGDMTLEELKELIRQISTYRNIIGVDICGENPQDTAKMPSKEELAINNRTNGELWKMILTRRNMSIV